MVKIAKKCLLKAGILGLSFSIFLAPSQVKATEKDSDLTSSQQSFINEIAGHAQKIQKKYKVLSSIIISQAILESNWGKSKLAQVGKNLFGVKGAYKGKSVLMPTKEFEGNKWIETEAHFCAYPSWYESLCDQARLFSMGTSWDKKLYAGIIHEKNYQKAAKVLALGGYSTDPDYSEKLIQLIQSFNLTKFDQLSEEKENNIQFQKKFSFWNKILEESYSHDDLYQKYDVSKADLTPVFYPEKKLHFAQLANQMSSWLKKIIISQISPLHLSEFFGLTLFSGNETNPLDFIAS